MSLNLYDAVKLRAIAGGGTVANLSNCNLILVHFYYGCGQLALALKVSGNFRAFMAAPRLSPGPCLYTEKKSFLGQNFNAPAALPQRKDAFNLGS